MAFFETVNLKMYYNNPKGLLKAVDGVSLEINKGESLGLAGESGCGKSSIAMALLRILPVSGNIVGGSIFLDGLDLTKMPDEEFRKKIRWKRIAMIFQSAMNSLNPVHRVDSQIAEAIINAEKVTRKKAMERVEALLKKVGINPKRARDYPHEFSGGMKQRAVIAMAMACNPDLIIADEPTTALDVIMQAQVLKSIQDLRSEHNLSMILISHDLSVIAQTCDNVAVMYGGRIVEYGTLEQICYSPAHPYTQGLISAFPNMYAKKTKIQSIPGITPDLVDPPPGCSFYPRCPIGDMDCTKEIPPFVLQKGSHKVACIKAKV